MIILQEIATEQTFSFIPRSQVYDSMFVRDDQTNSEVEITIASSSQGDYYDTITATFDIKENHFYDLTIKNGSDIVHLDRIFCTNQPVATYSINNGEFTSRASNNEFIIYE